MVDIGDAIHRGVMTMVDKMSPERLLQNAIDAAEMAQTAAENTDNKDAVTWAAISEAWCKAAEVAANRVADDLVRADMKSEGFEDWTRRELSKLAAQITDAGLNRAEPGWYERASDGYALPESEADNHTGRLLWCIVYLSGGDSMVIPQHVWDQSGGASVTVTQRQDGGKLVRRS